MKSRLSDLREFSFGDDETLILLGFQRWEEPTTDSVRWVHFTKAIRHSVPNYNGGLLGSGPKEPDHQLGVTIRFTLALSDGPGPLASTHSYSFEGVTLEISHSEPLRLIAAFATNVTTLPELHRMLAAFEG